MSANNNEGSNSSSSDRQGTRFPAPRPRAAQSSGNTMTAARPAAAPAGEAGGQAAGNRPPRPRAGGAQNRPQAARPTSGARPGAPRGSAAAQRGLVRPTPKAKVRKARLLVSKVDPWSVLKMSFLLSVALGIMTVVCAVTLWSVMDLTGIFDRVDDLLSQILGPEAGGFAVNELISLGQVASFATIIAVINVVLLTVLSMLVAVLYNLSASLVGGIGVTLTDD